MIYLVFAGNNYYPGGGWDDFRSMHVDLPEAIYHAEKEVAGDFDWAQVVDLSEECIVKFFTKEKNGQRSSAST